MATTTNFGWETPDDTDLVKDGAAAMRTLGNSIDSSFVDLKGGTTDQILTKASNTDLDYTWGGTWTTWTPTYTNLTVGNGTVTARYVKLAKTVFFDFKIVFGSTTSISGVPTFTLPSNSKSDVFFFDGNILDAGIANYNGAGQVLANTNAVYWKVYSVGGTYLTAGNVSSTAPMTWGTSDEYFVHGFYEEA